MSALTSHAGDCTIYRALINGRPYDGICTCGYGWQKVREGDDSAMMSEERFTNYRLSCMGPYTVTIWPNPFAEAQVQ